MTEYLTRSPIVVTHEHGLSFAAQIREHRVITDQSIRVGGEDTAPSPMELVSAALGSCVALYVHQFCVSRGLRHDGMRVEVTPRHVANPHRIGELSVAVFLPGALSPHTMEMLERVVRSCPVHNTLVHGAAVSVSIEVGAAAHAVRG
ncbi:MAG TPA: OsmC family protein [Gemmatimonadaceae bacterium]